MFQQSLGIYNIVWFGMAFAGLWLLNRILVTLKALHFIELQRFRRERPETFED